VDGVGSGYRGQIILMNNRQDVMTERQMLMNEIIFHNLLGKEEGSLQYYTVLNAPSGSSSENMDKVKQQLNQFLSTVSKFVPFNLKNLKIPEICYEKEIVEDAFERELENSKVDEGSQVTNLIGKSGYVDEMVPSGNFFSKLFGGQEKLTKYELHKEEEVVPVTKEVTTRKLRTFRKTYKIRFDGTRDVVKEEEVGEKLETF